MLSYKSGTGCSHFFYIKGFPDVLTVIPVNRISEGFIVYPVFIGFLYGFESRIEILIRILSGSNDYIVGQKCVERHGYPFGGYGRIYIYYRPLSQGMYACIRTAGSYALYRLPEKRRAGPVKLHLYGYGIFLLLPSAVGCSVV